MISIHFPVYIVTGLQISVKNNNKHAHQALSFYIQFGSLMQFNVRAELKGDSVRYENG